MSVTPAGIPHEPVTHIAFGLFTVFFLVLVLPFKVKRVEENLEAFFLAMGIIAVTISGLWSGELVKEAITAPVMIGGLPIGIFQVVLIAGIVIYYFNKPIYGGILKVLDKLGFKLFVFLLIVFLGLASSLISVIVQSASVTFIF